MNYLDLALSVLYWGWEGLKLTFKVWVYYLAYTSLSRALTAGTMTPAAKYVGYVVVGIGGVLDLLLNLTVGTLLFWALPKLRKNEIDFKSFKSIRAAISHTFVDLTFSARLSYYYNTDDTDTTRRKRMAVWLARNFLNAYDTTKQHIT